MSREAEHIILTACLLAVAAAIAGGWVFYAIKEVWEDDEFN